MAGTISLILGIANALVGSPDFDTRERASADLSGPLANLLALSDDAEVVHRASRKADREMAWRHFSKEWDARGWPYLDSIPLIGGDCYAFMEYAAPNGAPDWDEWKRGCRRWAKQMIEAGYWPLDLRASLLAGEQRSKYWLKHRCYPPLDWGQ